MGAKRNVRSVSEGQGCPWAGRSPAARQLLDMIMPKQFLKDIDRSSLDRGTLQDMHFDTAGAPCRDFVLNRLE